MTAIRYEDLIDVADAAKDWYAGQRDPVYALVSSVYAGRDVPLSIAEDALFNLERDYRALREDKPAGWRQEAARLQGAIAELEYQINTARTHAGMQPNPTGGNKVHIGRRGSGTAPVCGRSASRTSQLTMSVVDFDKQPIEDRCVRCEAKRPTLLRLATRPKENPLAMGNNEKLAITVGIVAGVAALAWYVGTSIGAAAGTAIGKAV